MSMMQQQQLIAAAPSKSLPKSEGQVLKIVKNGRSPLASGPSAEGSVIGSGGQTGAQANRKSRNSNKEISQESDSFYKYYNKEIKVNQEEIPIVLYELVDAAYNYIQRESYEKALILLQKTEGVLEVVSLESSKRDKYIAFSTFHNMAMCYQKLGMLEECFIYLKECLQILTAPLPKGIHFYKYNSENCVAARMKHIKQEGKLKLQLCAIMSQTQNHSEALDNAKKSVKLIHQLFKDLLILCGLYVKKIERKEKKKILVEDDDPLNEQSAEEGKNFMEESISMLERTSMKLYPIVKEVVKRLIDESPVAGRKEEEKSEQEIEYEKILNEEDSPSMGAADMRSVLGFLNQNEWVYALNIGNIMQLQAVSLKTDLLSQCRNECELSRESFLEKIALLSVAYFCVSTEMRFILQSREQYLSSPVKRQRELESEYWHAKSLEIACTFLPSECPLLNHILLSYQKHHDPSLQPIKEDQEQTDVLSVIRPLNGIESNKYQPIIRQITSIKVAITPCLISPLTKRIFNNRPFSSQPPKNPTKEEPAIVMQDQKDHQIVQILHILSSFDDSPAKQEAHTSLYSDEYYDQFLKKMFDENPLLDKKHLATKLLSHLQSADYSFLQQQINDQHQDSPLLPREKEQRRTIMHFEDDEFDNRRLACESSEAVDVEDILMVDKSFDIIQRLLGDHAYYLFHDTDEQLQGRNPIKSKLIVSGLDELSPDQAFEEGIIEPIKSIVSQGGAVSSVASSLVNKHPTKIHQWSQQHENSLSSKQMSSHNSSSSGVRKKGKGVQKLMSYLEGDSLLKEIERSLENHQRQEEEGKQDGYEADDAEGPEVKPLNTDGMTSDEEDILRKVSKNTAKDTAVLSESQKDSMGKSAVSKKKLLSTPHQMHHLKSSTSNTRPSSSITNNTSGTAGGRRTSHSFLMKKHKRNGFNKVLPHQFTSQQHPQSYAKGRGVSGSPMMSSDDSNHAHSEGRQVAITSITVNSGPKKPKRSLSKDKLQGKNLSKVMANSAITQSAQKRSNAISSSQNPLKRKQQPFLQLSETRKERSRVSNQNHFKSFGVKNANRLQLEKKQPLKQRQGKSKSSEENEGRSSSTKRRIQNACKKRENSAECTTHHRNPESITPLGRGSQIPLLSQPSFSDHTNTGTKNSIGHNYSVELSMVPILGQRNQVSSQKQGSQSISSLQQQVLLNQKLLMQFQQQQIRLNSKNRDQRKRNKVLQEAVGMSHTVFQPSSMDQSKKISQSRSKSNTGQNKRTAGSMTTAAGLNLLQRLNTHQQSMDQQNMSRQTVYQGLQQSTQTTKHPSQQSFQQYSQSKKQSNKENLAFLSKGSNLPLHQSSIQQVSSKPTNPNMTAIKKSIKELASGLLANQRLYSREIHHVNTKSKAEQERLQKSFFDHNSPQLLRKKKKAGSQTPPKKHIKSSQKGTGELKHLISGASSKQGTASGASKLNFSTQDSRGENQSKKRGSQFLQNAVNNNQKLLHSSFIQDQQDEHSQSWWMLPENNQSFDAIVKGSFGGQPICVTEEGNQSSGTRGSNIKRGSSRSNNVSTLIENPLSRPSFGIGPIHRGSSDTAQMSSQSLLKHNSHQISVSGPLEASRERKVSAALLKQMRINNILQGNSTQSRAQRSFSKVLHTANVHQTSIDQRKAHNLRA